MLKLSNYTIDEIQSFCGVNEENIKILEDEFKIDISIRGDEVHFSKDNKRLKNVIFKLLDMSKRKNITNKDVIQIIELSKTDTLEKMEQLYKIKISRSYNGEIISPKTIGQRDYYYSLKNNDVVFGIGPAGTGKTYLAVVFAIEALKNNEVQRIILTRPAVEAGESLGFLPGDLKEKVDPYLRPLYDALYDMLGIEATEKMIEKGIIEIAPLAYMRGRTLDDAYVILDEAQNTTDNQMKMFLTRLGFNSKMIITGDKTQIDLTKGELSGLKRAERLLKNVKGIKFNYLSALDVVRHPVVARIINKYEEDDRNGKEA